MHILYDRAILTAHQNHGQYFFQIILSVRRILPRYQDLFFHGFSAGKHSFDGTTIIWTGWILVVKLICRLDQILI